MALGVAVGVAACDDDGPTGPTLIDLETVSGEYDVQVHSFDPQGSAPPGNIVGALEGDQGSLTLNVGKTGNFQLLFSDAATGDITTVNGQVEALEDGIELNFASEEAADQFLLPLTVPLQYEASTETLSFTGAAEIDRARLMELFPDLYADEQLFDPTPGTLTVVFQKPAEETEE